MIDENNLFILTCHECTCPQLKVNTRKSLSLSGNDTYSKINLLRGNGEIEKGWERRPMLPFHSLSKSHHCKPVLIQREQKSASSWTKVLPKFNSSTTIDTFVSEYKHNSQQFSEVNGRAVYRRNVIKECFVVTPPVSRKSRELLGREYKKIFKQLRNAHAMKFHFKKFEI